MILLLSIIWYIYDYFALHTKKAFLTCDVSDELIEIYCKYSLTLTSFVAQKKLRECDDGNSTFSSVDSNAVW